jgi:hypothetical protein
MLKDLLTKLRSRRLLGCVALALLLSGTGYTLARLKSALDEREALPAALDRLESAGLAARQDRRTLETLGDVLERSTSRMALLTEGGTIRSSAPLPDEERAHWQRVIAEERSRIQNDQGLLAQLAQGTKGLLGSMVGTLRQQLSEEDHAWAIVEQHFAARHDHALSARDDELLREFAASLMKIGQSVSAYQDRLREASNTISRVATLDDARLSALLARAAVAQRSIALYLTISAGALLLLAVPILASRLKR